MLIADTSVRAVGGVSLLRASAFACVRGRCLRSWGRTVAGKSTCCACLRATCRRRRESHLRREPLARFRASSEHVAARSSCTKLHCVRIFGAADGLDRPLSARRHGQLGMDRAIARRALARAGAAEFDSRSVETLSGGEFAPSSWRARSLTSTASRGRATCCSTSPPWRSIPRTSTTSCAC